MSSYSIVETVTKDSLVHQGLFFRPEKIGTTAILWVHGLTANFYGDIKILSELAIQGEKSGIGVAAFNNRGHDVITNLKKIDEKSPKGRTSVLGGSAYETFTDCAIDIDAGVTFLTSQGFSKIIVMGISTGANKVCYFAGTKNDPRAVGIVLLSPLSDVAVIRKSENYQKDLAAMKECVRDGTGDELCEGYAYFPLTPKRYLSLYESGSDEDVFDYYREKPKLATFSHITMPLCVVFGGSDEYTERPIVDILSTYKKFQHSRLYKDVIIPDGFHGFGGKEKEVVEAIYQWVQQFKM